MNRALCSTLRTLPVRGLFGIAASFLLVSTIACGSNAGLEDAAAGSPAQAFAGRFQATWVGSFSETGAATQNGTGSATITVSAADDHDILMAWQVANEPESGTITFAVSGAVATAVGSATGGSCYMGLLPNGDQATVCATSASAQIDGDTLTQDQTGTFTGVSAQGTPVSGTYVGTWTGVRVR